MNSTPDIFNWKPTWDLEAPKPPKPHFTSGVEWQQSMGMQMVQQAYFPMMNMMAEFKPRVSPLEQLSWDQCLVIAGEFCRHFDIPKPTMVYDEKKHLQAEYHWGHCVLTMHKLNLINIIHELVHHLTWHSYRRIMSTHDMVVHGAMFVEITLDVVPWLPKLKGMVDATDSELLQLFHNLFLYPYHLAAQTKQLNPGVKNV